MIDIFFKENSILIILLALWTIPWKGFALWKAAQNRHKWWFIVLLIVNTLAVLEILYIFVFSKKGELKSEEHEGLDKARQSIQERKEITKGEIMELFQKQERVTNNDVEEMFKVSDSTATNYLQELEKEGKIVQKGETGRGVYYTKNG